MADFCRDYLILAALCFLFAAVANIGRRDERRRVRQMRKETR